MSVSDNAPGQKNSKENGSVLSRRDFVKMSLITSGALGVAAVAGAGVANGKDHSTYTGANIFHGEGQFFNRKPFEVDEPTYEVVGETRSPVYLTDHILIRVHFLESLMMPGPNGEPPTWTPDMGAEGLPEPLHSYMLENPEKLENFKRVLELQVEQAENWELYEDDFFIADAWASAQNSAFLLKPDAWPPVPAGPPEEWDFRDINPEPKVFKSTDHASELLKTVAHTFGATLVGITKFNPDYHFLGGIRGTEGENRQEPPAHWQYAIVFGVPHEWDQLFSSPVYGTTYDAYSRLRQIGGKMDSFIRQLGYPCRMEIPPLDYDISLPPLAIDAGLGEQGRMGVCVTPETGANIRLGVVLTNIPMTPDKPIDFGVQEFCKNCKICAEQCPSGAISLEDEPGVVRGYKRWQMKEDLCYNVWNTVATPNAMHGCRVCLAVCPYSRKDNWVHAMARTALSNDPTPISRTALHWMSKNWYEYPEPESFLPPTNDSFREPPTWLKPDEWFES